MADFKFTPRDLETIRDHPHLLGHLIGKTKLTEMHSDWIKTVWDTKNHIGFQGHRGSYKTTSITEVGIIRWLLFSPSDRIALIRKPYEEAAKTLAAIKGYFQLEPIQALFRYAHGFHPRLTKSRDKSVVFSFKRQITKEGSIDAYGPDGSLTGNHYDKILCDDVVTLKDRISRAEREKTKEAFREIIVNIIDPGKQVMLVGTPWHRDDANTILPTIPENKWPVSRTGMLTEAEIAEKRKYTTAVLYSINYDLKHIVDEDAIFIDPVYDHWSWKHKTYAHIDAKFQGDHTGALTIMCQRPDGKVHGKGFLFDKHIKECYKRLVSICKRHNVREVCVENNPDKGWTASFLGSAGLRVDEYHEDMNKDFKIQSFLTDFWPDIIWDHETEDEYLAQILDYREGEEPNDAPDSASSLLRRKFHKMAEHKTAQALWEL